MFDLESVLLTKYRCAKSKFGSHGIKLIFCHVLHYLNRPFPAPEDYKKYLIQVGAISIFITLFLWAFRPFGLHQMESGMLQLAVGFGLVTFFTSIIFDFFIRKVLRVNTYDSSFTLIKWIITTLILITGLGVTNFYYMKLVFDDVPVVFWNMLFGTLTIGLFPLLFFGTIAVIRGERQFGAIAADLNTSKIVDQHPTEKRLLDIDVNNIRYIKSMQNYVTIGYFNQNFEKYIYRHTISALEKEACRYFSNQMP